MQKKIESDKETFTSHMRSGKKTAFLSYINIKKPHIIIITFKFWKSYVN